MKTGERPRPAGRAFPPNEYAGGVRSQGFFGEGVDEPRYPSTILQGFHTCVARVALVLTEVLK